LKREDKKKIAAAIHDCFEKSKVVILTDYKGLDVSAMNDLRRKLRAADVEYKVVKNTLIARAADGTDAELIKEHFKGPSALALSYEDPVAPAKVLVDFAKNNKVFEIKIGVMDGKVIDANEIRALSTLPSREVLLGQVLSAMNGVPTSLVRALNNVTVNLLNVLQAIGDQKEAA
jgi:large subunit ribosomal protein L10